MKSKIKKIFLLSMILLLAAQPAFADIVFCGGRSDKAACTVQDLFALVYVIVNYLISMAGLIAVMFIVWGGLQMMLAGGDPGKITTAKQTIWHAILGLIIVLMVYLIIGYVAGLFLPNSTDPLRDLIKFVTKT
jgi:hypothetical protein